MNSMVGTTAVIVVTSKCLVCVEFSVLVLNLRRSRKSAPGHFFLPRRGESCNSNF